MPQVSWMGEARHTCCPAEVAEFHPETYYLNASYSNLQCGKQQLLYSRDKCLLYSRPGSEAEYCIKIKLWKIEGDRSYHISKLARALKHIFNPCEKPTLVS